MQANNSTAPAVALLFGGQSSEHEVSRVSAGTFADNIDPSRYQLIKIGITKDGRWLCTAATTAQMADGSWEVLADNIPCVISCSRADHGMILFHTDGQVEKRRLDVVIPALHGLWGEDGTVQGLLELAGIPYVGCGVLASAACMDKAVANALFEANGIPHCRWASYTRFDLDRRLNPICRDLEDTLGYPMFVKPANAGSSVGVSRATDIYTLRTAIEMALREDDKLVFEAAVNGQEVECAVLGNEVALATLPGEIVAGDAFYTYDDKYKNGVSQTLIPAQLPEAKLAEVRTLAAKAYTALGCEGLSRCDFFVEKGTGRVLINEINTFPGFTPISMWPKLMESVGLSIADQIDELILLALERAEKKAAIHHG
ncbi:MAG: D-alanine--D-alanine ligase [Faecalibacterium sp.]|nr:D-alanine--D-alanine ligase [Faecalibacterium sp.]